MDGPRALVRPLWSAALICVMGCAKGSTRPAPVGRAVEPGVSMVIEIPAGSVEKIEWRDGAFEVDRVLPPAVGGYPTNYGFIPCTRGPDGDPIDALLPGPPLPTGARVHDAWIVGVLNMTDEKGIDPKILLERPGSPTWTSDLRAQVSAFFGRYKDGQAGRFSEVLGFDGATSARSLVVSWGTPRPCEAPP